jgi:hypothetical protein
VNSGQAVRLKVVGHFRLEFLAADAVAQGDGDGTLGVAVANNVFLRARTISRGVSSSNKGTACAGR